MISQEKFLEKCIETNIPTILLKRFYVSIPKSVTYRQVGKILCDLLLRIEEKHQWSVLQKIDNPGLKIYKEAEDKKLVKEFVEGIKLEKRIRESKEKKITINQKEYNSWSVLKDIILRRAKIYEKMFDFSEDEIKQYEKTAEKLVKRLKARRAKKWFSIMGTGAGVAAGVVGAAGAYWLYKKAKK